MSAGTISSTSEIEAAPHASMQTTATQILGSEADINDPATILSNDNGYGSSSHGIQPIADDKLSQTSLTRILSSNARKSASRIHPFQTNSSADTIEHGNDDLVGRNPKETNDEERKVELKNLISQEIKYVKEKAPKLGKHQEYLRKRADEVMKSFEKMQEGDCGLKELKDLKRTITKLKLQIPARFRTFDANGQYTGQQSDDAAIGKGLHRLPRFHNRSAFVHSPVCKSVQERYEKLPSLPLKLCLLCFTVFPENAIISRRLMVYWWIGEGLLPLNRESKTEEELANQYFNELLEAGFIEPVDVKPGCKVAICKMHPMIRAALVTIADEVKFFDIDEDGKPKDFGKIYEIGASEENVYRYPNGVPRELSKSFDPDIEIFPPSCRSCRVCLMGNGVPKGLDWEKLHMLFNVEDDILELKPEWFSRMNNVNVVFLGRWQSSATHHIEVEDLGFLMNLENLKYLRFFSLQGVSTISELPESISHLENLVVLDLRACHNLEKIPKGIGSLACLTHLDMSECYLLDHMPKELGSLIQLQVLKGFIIADSPSKSSCTLDDLAKLLNLRKLSMYTRMNDFPDDTHLEAFKRFKKLVKLTIAWGGHASHDEQKQANVGQKKGVTLPCFPKHHHRGARKRIDASKTNTFGSELEKLDLKCYPHSDSPSWLTPENMKNVKNLYIRGGRFSDLGQFQDFPAVKKPADEPEAKPKSKLSKVEEPKKPADEPGVTVEPVVKPKHRWSNVEVLRLKYLDQLEMDWKELLDLFPKLKYIEKVKCPKLTLFPCDESGVWMKEDASS